MTEKLGIIQSRGLGDILIALPIANHYRKLGNEIYWPICEEFYSHVKNTVPWVNWIPIVTDNGSFFYDVPMAKLHELGIENALCLYQSLTGHPEFSSRPEFQITKFDQYKYHVAQVPFLDKWKLSECITRDHTREFNLKKNLQINDNNYVLVHLTGSDHKASLNRSWIPQDLRVIEIEPKTDCIFDWLGIMENAQAIIAVDSAFSNLIDQLGLTQTVDCYFIPRSHIQLTPVLGGSWTVIEPEESVKNRITIFRSN